MSYIPTAPDLKDELRDTIRARRKKADDLSSYDRMGTDRVEAGRYTAAAGAIVTVAALLKSSEHRAWAGNVPNGYEQRIAVAAEAKCHGNGCIDPAFRAEDTGYFLLDADADVTAEAALPYVQKAREWAQAHAEKCRAQPYTR